jgi:hypothetical protein
LAEDRIKEIIFCNPEGFAGLFITKGKFAS